MAEEEEAWLRLKQPYNLFLLIQGSVHDLLNVAKQKTYDINLLPHYLVM